MDTIGNILVTIIFTSTMGFLAYCFIGAVGAFDLDYGLRPFRALKKKFTHKKDNTETPTSGSFKVEVTRPREDLWRAKVYEYSRGWNSAYLPGGRIACWEHSSEQEVVNLAHQYIENQKRKRAIEAQTYSYIVN